MGRWEDGVGKRKVAGGEGENGPAAGWWSAKMPGERWRLVRVWSGRATWAGWWAARPGSAGRSSPSLFFIKLFSFYFIFLFVYKTISNSFYIVK
jgi:hypothetical protein